jgi:hypothetical protein
MNAEVSDSMNELVAGCTDMDVEKRPSAREILEICGGLQ